MSIFDEFKSAKILLVSLGLAALTGCGKMERPADPGVPPSTPSSDSTDTGGFRSPLGYLFDGIAATARKLDSATYGSPSASQAGATNQGDPFELTGVGPISDNEFEVSYKEYSFNKSPYVCVIVKNQKLDTQDIVAATLIPNKSLQRVMHLFFMGGRLQKSEVLMKPTKDGDLQRAWQVPEDPSFDQAWRNNIMSTISDRFGVAVDRYNAAHGGAKPDTKEAVKRPVNPAYGSGPQERNLTE